MPLLIVCVLLIVMFTAPAPIAISIFVMFALLIVGTIGVAASKR